MKLHQFAFDIVGFAAEMEAVRLASIIIALMLGGVLLWMAIYDHRNGRH